MNAAMPKGVKGSWPMGAAAFLGQASEQAHRQDPATKVAPIQRTFEYGRVKLFELREGERRRQQVARDIAVFELRLKPAQRVVGDHRMVVRERRQPRDFEPPPGCVFARA